MNFGNGILVTLVYSVKTKLSIHVCADAFGF